MIRLQITMTSRPYGEPQPYRIFAENSHCVADMAQAKIYLQERYGKCKRSKMYIDKKDSDTVHCGYIFCFHAGGISHLPVERWLQQDWVTFYSATIIDLAAV